MVLTVEPGLYFIPGCLEAAKQNELQQKHLNFEVIKQYNDECGGFRIEDVVLVTADGCHEFPGAAK